MNPGPASPGAGHSVRQGLGSLGRILDHVGNCLVFGVPWAIGAPCCAGLFSHLSTTMSTDERARAWVDVSASALRENFRTVRRAVGDGVRIIPMVKANAYGLGVAEVVAALEPLGPWGYGVAAVGEGVGLRRLGIQKPILVCSPVPPASYGDAVENRLAVSISDLGGLASLREASLRAGIPGRFHLEVDTGMGRSGFDWHRVDDWAPAVAELLGPQLVWEGCFTHFHSADGRDEGPTSTQWSRFLGTVEKLPSMWEGVLIHACNSPGALRNPEYAGDAVRPGIFLYGGVAGDGLPAPVPVASLRARIVFLKDAVPARRWVMGQPTPPPGPSGGRPRRSATETGCPGAWATGARLWFEGAAFRSSGGSPWTSQC